MNQAYRARLEDERQYDAPGISVASLQNAQRAWLRYRDAFIAFARVKYPTRGAREPRRLDHAEPVAKLFPGSTSSL